MSILLEEKKKEILDKIDKIKSNVIEDFKSKSPGKMIFLEIINDELDEVLLNWSEGIFDQLKK